MCTMYAGLADGASAVNVTPLAPGAAIWVCGIEPAPVNVNVAPSTGSPVLPSAAEITKVPNCCSVNDVIVQCAFSGQVTVDVAGANPGKVAVRVYVPGHALLSGPRLESSQVSSPVELATTMFAVLWSGAGEAGTTRSRQPSALAAQSVASNVDGFGVSVTVISPAPPMPLLVSVSGW